MTFIRRQTEGSDGIHMTKEDKDLFTEESEKTHVHAVLESKERSQRVWMSLASDSQEQLAALRLHAGHPFPRIVNCGDSYLTTYTLP